MSTGDTPFGRAAQDDVWETSSVVHTERPPIRAYPANVTYTNLIAENRRKSSFLVALLIGLAILVGAAAGVVVGGARGGGQEAAMAALAGAAILGVIASLGAAWSWNAGPGAILSMAGAREIEKADDPQLFNVVEELSISGGMPVPKVYLIDDPSLNAFATGRDPANAAVAITTGLRATLTRDELAGVIAHELAHVRHYDIRLMMLMATMAGMIVVASDVTRRMLFYGGLNGGSGRSSRGGGGKQQGGNPLVLVLVVLSIVLLIVAPIVATLIRLAISRQREYLADAGAVELTRYPEGLIGALEKLGACRIPLKRQNEAIAPLFMVNPSKAAVERGLQDRSNLFMTHPPLHERIARLRALT
ncbi:MAG: M48 family metallopeptidase [Phycisphaerae bacterium]|nr:M48 family metallopeptidase [Phycisphaerae bacterium]